MYNVSYSNIKSSLLNIPLGERSTNVISVCTGPNASITQLDLQSITINTDRAIAGVIESTSTVVLRESLYNGSNGRKLVGDPIADMYGDILLGGNNTITAIADGCGWDKKPHHALQQDVTYKL